MLAVLVGTVKAAPPRVIWNAGPAPVLVQLVTAPPEVPEDESYTKSPTAVFAHDTASLKETTSVVAEV
jgi:hypothetical protein